MRTFIDAGGPLNEAMREMEAMELPTDTLSIRFRRHTVAITLTGRAVEQAEAVRAMLIREFTEAGWGFRLRSETELRFDHPQALAQL